MTNNIAKIRAALEQAYKERHEPCSVELRIDEALAALAELERAAAEPVAWRSRHSLQEHWIVSDSPKSLWECQPLYAAPPAPVAEIREAVKVTDEMARRVANSFYGEDTAGNAQDMREVLGYWHRELGKTFGLVEIRKPTDDECRNIWREAKANEGDGSKVCAGRAMFDACRAVMWLKEGL